MNIRALLAAALIAAPAIALGQAMNHDMGGQALMQANERMMDAMQDMEPSGDTDKDFATMMVDHHKGAIDMAKVQLEHGDDPELRALAEKIIADQEKEISQLQEWLSRQAQ
jgi:uncharacterized protein (DUF305 family)